MLPAVPKAILLTHVHMGHIAGLLQLGREAMQLRVRLHATSRVCAFLRDNAPWNALDLELREIAGRFTLEPGLDIEAVPVPHRDEHSDTVAYLVFGPKRTLLYLPDITNHLAQWSGLANARVMTHSVAFAVIASPVLGLGLTKLGAVSFRRATGIAFLSAFVHDVLDVLQGAESRPWWPISHRVIDLERGLLPLDPVQETTLFGAALVLFALAFALLRRWRPRGPDHPAPRTKRGGAAVWTGRALIAAILLTASATHYLSDVRMREIMGIQQLLHGHEYAAALERIDDARLWPAAVRPGRLDYLQAEALLGKGERRQAEEYYHRAYRQDPTYFWLVADLAVFYSSSDKPASERRRLAEPYIRRLRNEFSHRRAQPRILARIERKLAGGVQ